MAGRQYGALDVSRIPCARLVFACVCIVVASTRVPPFSVSAQQAVGGDDRGLSLDRMAPELYWRLVGLERAQGVLFGALVAGNGKVDEADVRRRMMRRIEDPAASARPDPDAERGMAALGARGAEVIRRAFAFHREVLAVFASRPPAERRSALDALVQRYRSQPGVALPDVPKDMTILYDHPYTSLVPPTPPEIEPLRELPYPTLTGVMWSAHWYKLAAFVPLEYFDDPTDRTRALAVVADRYARKLASGAPPDAFPSELPLAPAIAPGLVLLHDRAAAIVDNFDMMLDVLTDVLVHPAVPDRQAAVDEVFAQFTDRAYRCVKTEEWIVVALRHSIFAQGGPALATMTTSERNGFSGNHGQHYGPRRPPPPCDPE